MQYDNLEFHNVAELVSVDNRQGRRLQRIPERVRPQLNEGTAGVMLSPANSEIRFRLAEGRESATITLSSECPATVFVYHGPFQGGSFQLESEPGEYTIKPHKRILQLTKEDVPDAVYDPRLVRLCFGGAYPEPVYYHGHDDGVAYPEDGDVPAKVYMAYGSSVAHGTDQSGAALSYPAHAAWLLGLDLRNMGASGCCLCEKAMADYLAEQPCDLVTLELSVNMIGQFTPDEFRSRAGYLVERVADADPKRKVVCITVFPYYTDIHERYRNPEDPAAPAVFRQILRDMVNDMNRPNLTLIEGADLLSDIGGLSSDLIHPGARGMIQIGEALAARIKTHGVL